MATRSQIRSRIQSYVASHSMIGTSDLNTIIDNEHQEILESRAWTRRKSETIIETSSTYSTGTVSTSGTTVTGSSTVFTSAMVGRYIRVGSNTFFHRITGFTSTTVLTIEEALPSDAAAGSTYTIFRHRFNLPSDFGRILNLTSETRLTEVQKGTLDESDPYRTATASRPDRYTIVGLDPDTTSSQIYQVEFYPVPSAVTGIRLEYLKTNTLSADTDEPLYRSDLLVWRGSEAACFFLHAKTGDQAWVVLAERYHTRYAEALEGALNDDLMKNSPAYHVKDTYGSGERIGDFLLDHDVLDLRQI